MAKETADAKALWQSMADAFSELQWDWDDMNMGGHSGRPSQRGPGTRSCGPCRPFYGFWFFILSEMGTSRGF